MLSGNFSLTKQYLSYNKNESTTTTTRSRLGTCINIIVKSTSLLGSSRIIRFIYTKVELHSQNRKMIMHLLKILITVVSRHTFDKMSKKHQHIPNISTSKVSMLTHLEFLLLQRYYGVKINHYLCKLLNYNKN